MQRTISAAGCSASSRLGRVLKTSSEARLVFRPSTQLLLTVLTSSSYRSCCEQLNAPWLVAVVALPQGCLPLSAAAAGSGRLARQAQDSPVAHTMCHAAELLGARAEPRGAVCCCRAGLLPCWHAGRWLGRGAALRFSDLSAGHAPGETPPQSCHGRHVHLTLRVASGEGLQEISLFETNIRVVGGLVAAFDLSGDRLFLSKAVELVDLMLPAMDDSRTGGGLALHTRSGHRAHP